VGGRALVQGSAVQRLTPHPLLFASCDVLPFHPGSGWLLPFGSKVASATADDVLIVACLCSTAPGDLLSFTPRLDSQNGSVLHGACSAWRFAVRAEQAV